MVNKISITMPEQDPKERVKNFNEVALGYTEEMAINEAKRLCSYPDDFKLIGNYSEQWARLGNSVMPKQMYHIAKTLKENILDNYYGKSLH